GQGHVVTGADRRGDQLLGAGLAVGLLPRATGPAHPVRAGARRGQGDGSPAVLEGALPVGAGGALDRHVRPFGGCCDGRDGRDGRGGRGGRDGRDGGGAVVEGGGRSGPRPVAERSDGRAFLLGQGQAAGRDGHQHHGPDQQDGGVE